MNPDRSSRRDLGRRYSGHHFTAALGELRQRGRFYRLQVGPRKLGQRQAWYSEHCSETQGVRRWASWSSRAAGASEGWSLDFVLPLTFIALVLPAIKDRTTTTAALSAGATAVLAAAMPLNLGLITAALVGVLGGLVAENVAGRRRR